MREYSYTLVEYDPVRPWIVRRQQRRTVTLADEQDFNRWAADQWPCGQFVVRLDPHLDPWPPAET